VLAESCVFVKQSQPPVHCDLCQHPGVNPGHRQRHPFSRSYGANLPSSLTRVLSIALVYSTYLPESVYGTSTNLAHYEAFLGSMGSTSSVRLAAFLHIASRRLNRRADLPTLPAYQLEPGHPSPGWPTLLRHPFARTLNRWYGNINPFSITYAFRPRLRSRLTLGGLTFPRKP